MDTNICVHKTIIVNYSHSVNTVGTRRLRKNNSAVFSFGYPPHWDRDSIEAHFVEIDNLEIMRPAQVSIANLSRPEHVRAHNEKIRDYGGDISPSSLVSDGNGFVVRMFFDDHPPPHFHVLLHRNTSQTQAKCTIERVDILAGWLPGTIRRRVREWAGEHRNELMVNWERCRMGNHPLFLGM